MTDLEERILEDIELQPHISWKYIDDNFFFWKRREDSSKEFIETLNAFIETLNACHPTIKFTAE